MRARAHPAGSSGRNTLGLDVDDIAGVDVAANENAGDTDPEEAEKCAAVDTSAVRAGHDVVTPVLDETVGRKTDRIYGGFFPLLGNTRRPRQPRLLESEPARNVI